MQLKHVTFGRFRLDAENECLWEGTQAIALRPKAFAVLKHLIERHGQLVTKQQLLDAVWPATFVSDAVLKDSIRQLRGALGDDAASPRYIETAHRRGYRFISQLTDADRARSDPEPSIRAEPSGDPAPRYGSGTQSPSSAVFGRDDDLARMHGWVERAFLGERQVIFVTGEPGIGKTTLVNAALERAAAGRAMWIASGQCLEHYGAGEAYLPVLDAVSRLSRGPGRERILATLHQHAPAWLLELPTLLPVAEREALRQQVVAGTRERMLREMAEALEMLSAEAPLILVLEDLHWSDYSTLDLIAYLARRRDPARLMVLGTYRPVEVILGDHPLKGVKRELQAHGLCHELTLEYLTEDAIAEYLAIRFPAHRVSKRLARLLHRRTEGNPLFMTTLVDYLIDDEIVVDNGGVWELRGGLSDIETGVPENVRQLIETQIERLSPDERRALEGASVVGMECSSVAIAAGLDESTAWVEEQCEALVRRHQFLLPARLVELPDGTMTARYRFSHVLHIEVPYGLLPPVRRAQIHRRIGERGEAIYQDRVREIAAELAMHFEQGRDLARAVKYLVQATENATHRSAHHEAASLARRGLEALETQPVTAERAQQEHSLRAMLDVSLAAIEASEDDEF
jgi:predicted ATPase/DNA-binding winged helix-turn-helix (wHTH) protein